MNTQRIYELDGAKKMTEGDAWSVFTRWIDQTVKELQAAAISADLGTEDGRFYAVNCITRAQMLAFVSNDFVSYLDKESVLARQSE